MNFLNADIPVILVEQTAEVLGRGINVIQCNYQRSVKSGRISEEQLLKRMALITPSVDMKHLQTVDLVIEAIFEDMSIKKEVFAKLGDIAKQGCILASNTSYLDLEEIADASGRPQDVVGMHFFSPANVMPLLEVVRGRHSDIVAVNTAMKLAKRINKTPVLSRVGWGFIANRVMKVRGIQSDNMILQGVSPEVIDQAIYNYGFAMGPFAMKDLVGLDVTNREVTEKTVEIVLVSKGRFGQKKNGGYYDYDESRQKTLSPVALDVIREVAESKEIKQIPANENEIMLGFYIPSLMKALRFWTKASQLEALIST